MCQWIYATYPVVKPDAPVDQHTSLSYELAADIDAPCSLCAESLVVARLYTVWKDTHSSSDRSISFLFDNPFLSISFFLIPRRLKTNNGNLAYQSSRMLAIRS